MHTTERRKTPRFKCRKPADFPVDVDNQESAGLLRNLSRDGISLESNSLLKEKQRYYFEIKPKLLPGNIPIEARVIWAANKPTPPGYLCGAQILNMDSSSKIELLDIFYEDWKRTVTTDAAFP